ncbi:MAG: DsbC family protein [Pontibacterium sp.]
MRKLLAAGLVLLGISGLGQAETAPEALIAQSLKKINARINAVSIEPADLKGFYAVELDSGELLYSDAKGEYFMLGQLFRLSDEEGFVNLTEGKRKEQRMKAMARVAEKDMIIFPAKGERKATVSVFTDVDCGYCRKLHKEVPALNAMGVQVNYLAFPRAGAGSNAHRVMESVWCAAPDKRNALMDQAKLGASVEMTDCESPVMAQYALGQSLGVTGTPALVFEDGSLVPGYMPAEQLARALKIN